MCFYKNNHTPRIKHATLQEYVAAEIREPWVEAIVLALPLTDPEL